MRHLAVLVLASLAAPSALAGECDPPVKPGDRSPGSYANPLRFRPGAGPVRVRKAAQDLTPGEQQRLQTAYAQLRTLQPNDPRSWAAQANVHCFFCAGSDANQIHG